MRIPDELVQIVDSALADATFRSGSWLRCGPGCSQCCQGVFAISALDAHRLRVGFSALQESHPAKAAEIEARVATSIKRLAHSFPGDPATGELGSTCEALNAFEEFANDEPCPALDPLTGTCDLYEHRPILCRTFGPPLQTLNEGLAVCDLCFEGAPLSEIERCQLDPSIYEAEAEAERLFVEQRASSGVQLDVGFRTIVSYGLAHIFRSSTLG